MTKPKKPKKNKKGIFETIRKPTAPPSRKLGPEKRIEKLDAVKRKAKHKKSDQEET